MARPCTLCPRRCGADRETKPGFCGAPLLPRVAKVMLHPWEEPCICFGKGAGAVFFSGCTLACVFCQNHEISRENRGRELDEDALTHLFFDLQEKGASCLDLVSPTPYLETIIPALKTAKKKGLSIPVVYNTGGYEAVETLARLDWLVDVYLPDLKYRSNDLALRYSGAKDYFAVAVKALLEMKRQAGPPRFSGEAGLSKNVIYYKKDKQ